MNTYFKIIITLTFLEKQLSNEPCDGTSVQKHWHTNLNSWGAMQKIAKPKKIKKGKKHKISEGIVYQFPLVWASKSETFQLWQRGDTALDLHFPIPRSNSLRGWSWRFITPLATSRPAMSPPKPACALGRPWLAGAWSRAVGLGTGKGRSKVSAIASRVQRLLRILPSRSDFPNEKLLDVSEGSDWVRFMCVSHTHIQ